jgi:hypothetical protein
MSAGSTTGWSLRPASNATRRGDRDARTISTPSPYGAHIRRMNQPSDTRFRVQKSLATVHGEEIAALCMELMPQIDTTLLATRPDLDGAVVLLRRDMDHGFAAIRAEMNNEFAAIRAEMNNEFAAIRADMDRELNDIRNEMRTGFAAIRAEMQLGFAEQGRLFAEAVARSTNQSLRWSIVTMVSMQAVLVAAVRLL